MPKHDQTEITFDDFFIRFYSQMIGYCKITFRINASDAEEIVTHAFETLWEHWETLDSHTTVGLQIWLKRALGYLSKNYFRNLSQEPNTIELVEWLMTGELGTKIENCYQIEQDVAEKDAYESLLKQIRALLNDQQWALFECVFVKQNSLKTAARLLDMKENTAKVALNRIKAKLKKSDLIVFSAK